jgi:hypothetical protein
VIGLVETLEARRRIRTTAPLGPNQGRGVASGFWFNHGGETSVSLAVGEDGTAGDRSARRTSAAAAPRSG